MKDPKNWFMFLLLSFGFFLSYSSFVFMSKPTPQTKLEVLDRSKVFKISEWEVKTKVRNTETRQTYYSTLDQEELEKGYKLEPASITDTSLYKFKFISAAIFITFGVVMYFVVPIIMFIGFMVEIYERLGTRECYFKFIKAKIFR